MESRGKFKVNVFSPKIIKGGNCIEEISIFAFDIFIAFKCYGCYGSEHKGRISGA
jgi:hypothetical protein